MKKYFKLNYYLNFQTDLILPLLLILSIINLYIFFKTYNILYSTISLLSMLCILTLVYFHHKWTKNLEIKKINLKSHNSPSKKYHQHKKIVFISDLHLHNNISLKYVNEYIKKINSLKPTMLLIGGDFITTEHIKLNILNLLKNFDNFPKICVLGNHDYLVHDVRSKVKQKNYIFAEKIKNKLNDVGFKVLKNEYFEFKITKNKLLKIFGLDCLLARKCDLNKLNQYKNLDIIISHNPIVFDKVKIKDSLVLAGHNHGGQFKIFAKGINPITISTKIKVGKFKKIYESFGEYLDGFYENKFGAKMYLTRGVGNSGTSLRIKTNPEIVVIEI